jgi:hypothetical protein
MFDGLLIPPNPEVQEPADTSDIAAGSVPGVLGYIPQPCKVSLAVHFQTAGRLDPGKAGERIHQGELVAKLGGKLDGLGGSH